ASPGGILAHAGDHGVLAFNYDRLTALPDEPAAADDQRAVTEVRPAHLGTGDSHLLELEQPRPRGDRDLLQLIEHPPFVLAVAHVADVTTDLDTKDDLVLILRLYRPAGRLDETDVVADTETHTGATA